MAVDADEFAEAVNSRDLRISSPKVIELSGADVALPSGSISIFLAPQGSGILPRIEQAATHNDKQAVKQILSTIVRQFDETIPRTTSLVHNRRDIPVLAESVVSFMHILVGR